MKHSEFGHTKSTDGTTEYCYQQQYCGSGMFVIIRKNENIVCVDCMSNEFGNHSFDDNSNVIYDEYNVFIERDNILYLCEPFERCICSNEYRAVINCIEHFDVNDTNDEIYVDITKHVYEYNPGQIIKSTYYPFGKEMSYNNMTVINILKGKLIQRWKNQNKIYNFKHGEYVITEK